MVDEAEGDPTQKSGYRPEALKEGESEDMHIKILPKNRWSKRTNICVLSRPVRQMALLFKENGDRSHYRVK